MSDQQNIPEQNVLVDSPKDFNSIWRDREIGDDWERRPPVYAPLIRNTQLDQFVHLRSDILRNVSFFEVIGQGAFGRVWKVTADLKVRENYPHDPIWRAFTLACKIIHHMDAYLAEVELALDEMRVLRYLRHENICNLAEIIGIPDSVTEFPYSVVCLFFEICDGDLHKIMEQYKQFRGDTVFPEKLSRHWFAQIVLALDYVHDNNIVHRDIKQPNILYRFGQSSSNTFYDMFLSSVFKLSDFGMSTDASNWPQPQLRAVQGYDVLALGKVLSSTGRPQDNQISPQMLNLLEQMHRTTDRITAKQILSHDWLQNNPETQTERFIFRTPKLTLPYSAWEP